METLHLETIVAAVMFAGVRIGGLMLFAPFLSSGSIPVQVKAGLTVALTALLYPVYGAVRLETSALGWAVSYTHLDVYKRQIHPKPPTAWDTC